MGLIGLLTKIVGSKNITVSHGSLEKFVKDQSPFSGGLPFAAVTPRNTKQVSKIMKLCYRKRIRVTVRGGGSSLTGASVPKSKSLILDMSKFKRLLETSVEDRYVIVEPGVKIDKINSHLAKYKYFYPPDPASSSMATIGGTISTNAGGLRAVTYGTTKEWILGLEVVLPDGRIIKTGEKTLKRSEGYDLTGLIIGSEGTLGVVTKATLKIWPMPKATGMVVAYFSTIENAGRAVGVLKKMGITPLVAEFIDKPSMELMKEYRKIRFPANANFALFIEIGSEKESLSRLITTTENIMKKSGSIKIEKATSPKHIEKLYEARKFLFRASVDKANKFGKEVMIADIVVPASKLPASLHWMQKVSKKSKLETYLFGHIGDGNVHANILYDKKSVREGRQVDRLQESLARIAIVNGGSVSGEHGIGLMKKKLLKEELMWRSTVENLTLMKEIKKVFDPKNILNVGKIFD